MLHCFQCGHDLPDNLAFCLHCGAALDDDVPTVVHPTPQPVAVQPQPKHGSGAGKFILGSLIGAFAVIVLLVIGAFILFSMRNSGEHPTNVAVNSNANINNNTNLSSPTPSRSPTPKKPTPTPSVTNENTEPTNAKTCTVINPAGRSKSSPQLRQARLLDGRHDAPYTGRSGRYCRSD